MNKATDASRIRNFCIIAHIDHGKSTLADRFLELTHTISLREKKDQILDSMDLERERGITIKMQPVTMLYEVPGRGEYMLNLIDTPGHVDFAYEVSRALAAVEGALLVVDATQGIQAQTLAHLYVALGENLTIIPVVNKIDLPLAETVKVTQEIAGLLGVSENDVIAISAKTGEHVERVFEAIIDRIPPPLFLEEPGTRALIFDSFYDKHRGVMCDIRVFSGSICKGDTIFFYQTKTHVEVKDVGFYTPREKSKNALCAGEIGYLVTGIHDVSQCQVGDTIVVLGPSVHDLGQITPLPGYQKVKPMVFANMYPKDQGKYIELKEALEELKLNDAALMFEVASSQGLGKGFKIGALGLLHLDIVQERILREQGIEVILTVPQVEYRIKKRGDTSPLTITSPSEFPDNQSQLEHVEEPWVRVEIVTPTEYIGNCMKIVMERRGEYLNTEYITPGSSPQGGIHDEKKRAILYFNLPLSELLTDFYDALKSVSSGYASLNYAFLDWREVELVKLTFLVAHEMKEALTMLVYKKEIDARSRSVLATLKKEIPPHLFEVRLQAAVGGKIIASERVKALRKDVTAKLYGGDVTRKRKLLEKQKKGKKKMGEMGSVDIPHKAYLAVLKR